VPNNVDSSEADASPIPTAIGVRCNFSALVADMSHPVTLPRFPAARRAERPAAARTNRSPPSERFVFAGSFPTSMRNEFTKSLN
jgi:hypothetical protein